MWPEQASTCNRDIPCWPEPPKQAGNAPPVEAVDRRIEINGEIRHVRPSVDVKKRVSRTERRRSTQYGITALVNIPRQADQETTQRTSLPQLFQFRQAHRSRTSPLSLFRNLLHLGQLISNCGTNCRQNRCPGATLLHRAHTLPIASLKENRPGFLFIFKALGGVMIARFTPNKFALPDFVQPIFFGGVLVSSASM